MILALLLAASSICVDIADPFDVDELCVLYRSRQISLAPWDNSNNRACFDLDGEAALRCSNGKYGVPLAAVPDPPPGEVYAFLMIACNEHGCSKTEHEGDTQ